MLKGPGENTVIPSLLSISLPLEEVSLAFIIHGMHLLYGSALCYYVYDHSCCVSSSINLGKLMSLLRLQFHGIAVSPTSILLPVSPLVWLYYRPVHLLA